MPLPTEPISGSDTTYDVSCECGFEGDVEGEDQAMGRWSSLFLWTCPTCESDHETSLDHWDGPYD